MARTTLDLDPTTLSQLKRRARSERKSMGQVASELLAQGLRSNERSGPAAPLRWSSWRLGTPRVDLEDKEAVRVALEEHR